MMFTMSNTQNHSMMASHLYMVSAATKNIKHLYYQVIQNSCIILMYNNPDWFYLVFSAISMLPPPGLTHSWCSNASTAFPLQKCEREESEPSSAPPSPPTASLCCLHLEKKLKNGPSWAARSDKGKQRWLVLGERHFMQALKAHYTLYQRYKPDPVLLLSLRCYIIQIFLSISVRGNKWQERYLLCWVKSKTVDMAGEQRRLNKPKLCWALEFSSLLPLVKTQMDQYPFVWNIMLVSF